MNNRVYFNSQVWLASADDGAARRIAHLTDELRLVQAALKCTSDAHRKHNLGLQRDRLEAAIKRLQVTITDDDTQTDNG